MKQNKAQYRFLFAGGGTGGHLFPAVAVAEKIKMLLPEAEILFVGTKSKIEGRIIPQLGYKFKSIWIKGFSRKFTLENLLFPIKLVVSIIQSIFINMRFNPHVAIGSGGYVSGPAIFGASISGAKIILLEQNSYPGVTTRLLEKKSKEIHLSFEDSKKYFKEKDKLMITGNPVRESLSQIKKEDALKVFGFNSSKKTLLILGGSLGAYTLNETASKSIKKLEENGIQVIWQTGKNYYKNYQSLASKNIWINSFIDQMNYAYAACDLLVARAGATTIAEILALGIPSILVPSPNVAANHQYYNAKSLSEKNAAILIEDKNINKFFFEEVLSSINDSNKLNKISVNAKALAKPEAASIIAKRAINLAKNYD
ncbi:MAG: undecaprenyldiphospho-muramoylpentapeptide beta-N-acetylglucosaminyltransferase [Ignavibacteriaceae bacterium]